MSALPPLPRRSRPAVQYAALPFRRAEGLEILLVTSRETRRWIIPKGWPMKGKKPHAAAAREALEEAGVSGRIGKSALGAYTYAKRLANGAPIELEVRVFPLEVVRERSSWQEKAERERRWFPLAEAVEAVDEPGLRDVMLAFARDQDQAATAAAVASGVSASNA